MRWKIYKHVLNEYVSEEEEKEENSLEQYKSHINYWLKIAKPIVRLSEENRSQDI